MGRIKRLKKIRLHNEGTNTLLLGAVVFLIVNGLLYFFLQNGHLWPFYIVLAITSVIYLIIVNFFRCPIRMFHGETENTVVAAADGKVVVIEEVDENEYFHDRRLMVSIFMSVTNVHANWFPVEGFVKMVKHHNGNFHKAWLPKASTENERSTIVIETPSGQEVLVRQVAGAVARRIVTYANANEECYIDEHLGFIKFGSRVDVYLPLNTEIFVKVGQPTVGNQTVIGRLNP
jgi:phosphatidylserine decarboxylase